MRGGSVGGSATRLHVIGGKGGVGKTTWAAATALTAAGGGAPVLLVSTDPAHSLGDALGRPLGAVPRRLPRVRGALDAMELDADGALRRWLSARRGRLRTIAERGTFLDEEDLERLLRLSFPGVDELMALVELARLARDGAHALVVVDTAPTGHTLRLLRTPETLRRIAAVLSDMHAKHRFLTERLGRGYRPDAADRLIEEIDRDGREVAALLRDPRRCRVTWLLLPEAVALEEARDGVQALEQAGIAVDEVVINRVTRAGPACPLCGPRAGAEAAVVAAARRAFAPRPVRVVPAAPDEPRGIAALRGLAHAPARARSAGRAPLRPVPHPRAGADAPVGWLEVLVPAGTRLVGVAGKGGVGKTTTAATIALAAARARPASRVLLLSADPAHSLGDVLGASLGDTARGVPGAPANLHARELDADAALERLRERYRRAVEETFEALLRGARFDVAYDREVLAELVDLAPPGVDELFATLAVVDALLAPAGGHDLVVLDMAPTGHALRLLEMPATTLAWVHTLLAILLKYRELVGLGAVAEDLLGTARRLRALESLLRDGAQARVVVVTRPAGLPLAETRRLLLRLRRLRVAVGAVVVNAVTPAGCAVCRRTREAERRHLAALRPLAGRHAIVTAPALAPPPRGAERLQDWARSWTLGA